MYNKQRTENEKGFELRSVNVLVIVALTQINPNCANSMFKGIQTMTIPSNFQELSTTD